MILTAPPTAAVVIAEAWARHPDAPCQKIASRASVRLGRTVSASEAYLCRPAPVGGKPSAATEVHAEHAPAPRPRRVRAPPVPTPRSESNDHAKLRKHQTRANAASVRVRKGRSEDRGHPATSERIYDDDESEWLAAVAAFKQCTGNRFPTNTELLALLKGLGYRKVPPCGD